MKQPISKKRPADVGEVPRELEPFVEALVDLLFADLGQPSEPARERDEEDEAA